MLTKEVVNRLYQTFSKRPSSADELDIALLFEKLTPDHNISIDDEAHLIIGSIDPLSPFHRIPLDNINGIVEFENRIAIVLHSSIIFLNKHDRQVHINIKHIKPSLAMRVRNLISRGDAQEQG